MSEPSILLIGGTGQLGGRIARLIRKRHPLLKIVISARRLERAHDLADEVGNADVVAVDLERPDLGLAERSFSLAVPAFKDHAHAVAAWALDRAVPYIAVSEAAFELAPLIALFAHTPGATLAIGAHTHGGLPSLIALALSRRFEAVESIHLGVVFDPSDPLPPGSLEDIDRITKVGPPPLILSKQRWQWLVEGSAASVIRPGSAPVPAEAVGLTDVLGLAGASRAASVRVDMGEGPVTKTFGTPGHEVVIRIVGRQHGREIEQAWTLHDPEGNVAFGSKGIVLLVERLLGLNGDEPIKPGLYVPETLIAADDALAALDSFGLRLIAHD